MEFLLDTANIHEIERYNGIYSITGVTSNPIIISREKADFFPTLLAIRKIIGNKQLHVQVTGRSTEEMIKEAQAITAVLGRETFIKVPTNEIGLKTIKALKSEGYYVTATAIYTVQQAVMAANVGANYVAPYFNRMCNNNYDAAAAIADIATLYTASGVKTKILAASFKNPFQIMEALLAGADAVTASPALFTDMVESPLIDSAIDGFEKDWQSLYGNKRIYEL